MRKLISDMGIPVGLIMIMMFIASHDICAQSDVIDNVRVAMKTGSSKELAKYFGSTVELNFDGEKSSYSRSQAEFVLRDFFKNYPPVDFEYIHQGASKQGLKYVIGKYSITGGSYRIWVLFKKSNDAFYVDTIDFTRE
ncbi:DUF4783 domain-containing protein [Bacteroidota bacterium]